MISKNLGSYVFLVWLLLQTEIFIVIILTVGNRDLNYVNCKVEPCPPLTAISDLHVLFCFHGIVESGKVFQPNHFVPVVIDDKPEGGEKRKLQTQKVSPNQQKSKSKKTSSINLVQSKISFPSFVNAPDPKPCTVFLLLIR